LLWETSIQMLAVITLTLNAALEKEGCGTRNDIGTMGRKLSDPAQSIKAYWAILNRLINKKKP